MFRDLIILTMMSTGLTFAVPMYLCYDVVFEDGELKIDYLAVYWELLVMIG